MEKLRGFTFITRRHDSVLQEGTPFYLNTQLSLKPVLAERDGALLFYAALSKVPQPVAGEAASAGAGCEGEVLQKVEWRDEMCG